MVVFLMANFWTVQKGRSLSMVVFSAGSFLDCAKGEEHKYGNFFFLLANFWTVQKGRSVSMFVFSDGSFLDCAKGKEHKYASFFFC